LTKIPPSRAYAVLGFLFAANLLNYVDRQVLYAVLPLVKVDLMLTDTQLGSLASAFMLVYMTAAPLIALFADRYGRRLWIGAGLLAWSGATFLTGLSHGFTDLFFSRSAVGIGESSYGSISPSFIAEHFPDSARARVLSIFSMAIPVGSALGYVFGGFMGHHFGWRAAFFWAGGLGIPMGVIALFLKEPRADEPNRERLRPTAAHYKALFKNKSFVLDTMASAWLTFTLGGLAVWMPTFFNRRWDLDVAKAGLYFGGVTVLGGTVGSLAGGWWADRLLKKTPNAYFLVAATGLLASLPFCFLTIFSRSLGWSLLFLGLAESLIFLNSGPLTAIVTTVTPLSVRNMGFAINIFFMHALGDAISPLLIGYVSDRAGLLTALSVAVCFLALGGLSCIWATRFYEADVLRAQEPSSN